MLLSSATTIPPEWSPPRETDLPDLIGAAMFACPPEWASERDLERAARALTEWSDFDEEFLNHACIVARRRLSSGRVRRDVVRLLERALTIAHRAAHVSERDARRWVEARAASLL